MRASPRFEYTSVVCGGELCGAGERQSFCSPLACHLRGAGFVYSGGRDYSNLLENDSSCTDLMCRRLDAVPAVQHHRPVAIPRRATPRRGARLAGTKPFFSEPLACERFSNFVATERLALAAVGIAVAHDGVVSRRCRCRNGPGHRATRQGGAVLRTARTLTESRFAVLRRSDSGPSSTRCWSAAPWAPSTSSSSASFRSRCSRPFSAFCGPICSPTPPTASTSSSAHACSAT
jgi:hypothetical protein